jgi:hypothetical protein
MFAKKRKSNGPKVLYALTPAEAAGLQAMGNVVMGIQSAIQKALESLAIRERFTPEDRAMFDGQRMAFVQAPPPPASPAPGDAPADAPARAG